MRLTMAEPGGAKYTKAQELGTPMLDKAALLALLGDEASSGMDKETV